MCSSLLLDYEFALSKYDIKTLNMTVVGQSALLIWLFELYPELLVVRYIGVIIMER
jgi:hypothetical protein